MWGATRMMLAEVRRLRPSRAVVRAIRVVVGLLVIGVLVVEGVALAGHSGALADALAHANLGLVALALALEVASWLAFAALHRRMLSSGGLRVPLPKIASVLLVANALSATLPVGSAVATGYNFTRFRRFGASVPLAAWVLVISGLISSATLGALGLAAASVVGSNRTSSVAAIIAVGVTLTVAGGLYAANQRPEAVVRLGRRGVRALNRISRRSPSHGFDRVDAFVAQIVMIRPRGRGLARRCRLRCCQLDRRRGLLRHGLSRRGDFRRGSADDRDRVRCGRRGRRRSAASGRDRAGRGRAGCRSRWWRHTVRRCHRRRSDLPRDQFCPRRCRWLDVVALDAIRAASRSGCARRPDATAKWSSHATPCPRDGSARGNNWPRRVKLFGSYTDQGYCPVCGHAP